MVHAAFQLAKRGVRSPSATQPLAAGWRCVSQRPRKQGLLVATMLGLLLLSATGSAWREIAPAVYASLRGSGLVLILLCILGRTWCTLYMGGRKNRELITRGPYSTMRNPLYLFSIVGTVGIGLLAGSVMAALLLGSIALAVFSYTVRREEAPSKMRSVRRFEHMPRGFLAFGRFCRRGRMPTKWSSNRA